MNACGSAIGGSPVYKASRLNGKSGFPAHASRFFDRFRPRKHAPLTAARPGIYNKCDLCHMGLCFPMDWRNQNMKPHSKFNAARRALLFWCLFIGIGAVAGAVGMLAAPDGSALGDGGYASLFSGASAGGISVPGFRFSQHCAFMCKRNSQPDCGSAAFQAQKGGDYLGRALRDKG